MPPCCNNFDYNKPAVNLNVGIRRSGNRIQGVGRIIRPGRPNSGVSAETLHAIEVVTQSPGPGPRRHHGPNGAPGHLPFSVNVTPSWVFRVGCPFSRWDRASPVWGAWAPGPVFRGRGAPDPERPGRPGRARGGGSRRDRGLGHQAAYGAGRAAGGSSHDGSMGLTVTAT